MKVVLASRNRHKLEEIQNILARYDMELVLQSDLGLDIDVEENGTSFEENSELKARAVMEASGLPAIADDSGLCVDALGGAPGIYSARYGAPDCVTDWDRLCFLLRNLKGIRSEERTARFVCVITLLYPDGRKLVARGTCEGMIAYEPSGEDGFGYDPVFYLPTHGCTFAQMGQERKNQISHRANALNRLCQMLEEPI
ncbi:MAG: RdgB/HAM1 family non-canonical purine NTP pyrophosphatase [Oscillospiraceae bacterium]|jgi:non-canonical purine NTP pyrophosphatase, rdgB/HAM1 family|nr:RdgB/HAM1 family non-canonical purine NTP pyrophosphatase [Oscillospiraceae bacterium]